jgi:hypothetical protein
MRTVLTEQEGKELLEQFFPTFVDIFNKSLASLNAFVQTDLANGVTQFTPHVKSMLMWHYAANHSSAVFGSHSEIRPVVYNKVYGLVFNEVLFIRFKKLSDQLHTSNIPTKQAQALQSQMEITGFPSKPCILTVGYVMDKTFTGFESINLICEKNSQDNHWELDILNPEVSTTANLGFNVVTDEPVSPSIEKLLKIKDDKKKKAS